MMTEEEIATRITATETRVESLVEHLEKLEADHEVLARLATALEVMATKQEALAEKMDDISEKVCVLEAVPAGKWKALIGYLIAAAASSGATWVATHWQG